LFWRDIALLAIGNSAAIIRKSRLITKPAVKTIGRKYQKHPGPNDIINLLMVISSVALLLLCEVMNFVTV
jgi:hypothetical protein